MKARKKTNNKKDSKFIRIKRFFNKIYDKYIKKFTPNIYWMAMPFVLMEVFIYIFGSNISYVGYNFISPVIFTLTWLVLFIGFPLCCKSSVGKKIYLILLNTFIKITI